jgi:hypothetical protein
LQTSAIPSLALMGEDERRALKKHLLDNFSANGEVGDI